MRLTPTPVQTIALVASGIGGLVLIVSSFGRLRIPPLHRRIGRYVGHGAVRSRLLVPDPPTGLWGSVERVLGPTVRGLAHRLGTILGGEGDLASRLDEAGRSMTVAAFRSQQVVWGGFAMLGALAILGIGAVRGLRVSPIAAVAAAGTAGVAGLWLRERMLDREIRRRHGRILSGLPLMADLLCLCVTAGESLRSGFERAADEVGGPLGDELKRALREARAGSSLTSALGDVTKRVRIPEVQRLVDAIVVAQERGSPLGDALRALAEDVREGAKQSLLESGGKRQIAMLAPVILMILPVALVFAFFPGFVSLRMLVR